jgi:ABC-type transport system involved in multi-copper enzyme maturation permease subunit
MNWLLWKEYRHNRLLVIVGLVLLIAPHVFGIGYTISMTLIAHHRGVTPEALAQTKAPIWALSLGLASLYSIGIAQVALALIGGNAIAGERIDRSAEFQASLPIPRKRIFAGKILFALLSALTIWLPNVALIGTVMGVLWEPHSDVIGLSHGLIGLAIIGITFYGVAWMVSSMIASPIFASCAGLITPWILGSACVFTAHLFDARLDDVGYWMLGLCLFASPICFGIGTWLYLRRVEP